MLEKAVWASRIVHEETHLFLWWMPIMSGCIAPCTLMAFRNNSHIRKNPTGHSSASVSAYYGHFRQLVEQSLMPEDQIIGGPGIVVEVDETKLGKRKYNKGHKVDGVWVLAGIEHTEKSRIFLVPIEKRDSNTLITAILEQNNMG